MDRRLRRELDRIAHDRRSGAAELALRATIALQDWMRRNRAPSERELLDVARALLKAQPSMAPLLRLANEVALAVDEANPRTALLRSLGGFRGILRTAPSRIAAHFRRRFRRKTEVEVVTYSYSSTVLRALLAARKCLWGVLCSESRPGLEGRQMAQSLARAGVRVEFMTDATLTGQVWPGQTMVLGADAVLNGYVAAKVGAKALVRLALLEDCPVIFATDTTKFWREPDTRTLTYWYWKFGSEKELWDPSPGNVDVYNLSFELTPLYPRLRFVTEKGWMTAKRVRRELKKIRISPRLKELVD